MQETRIQSLGQEDPLEEEMATHSSTLAWEIPWTGEPSGDYSSWGHKESDTTEQLRTAHWSPADCIHIPRGPCVTSGSLLNSEAQLLPEKQGCFRKYILHRTAEK